MNAVRRFDLLAPATARARRDEATGFLHTVVRATRTGVLTYRNRDGSVTYELRHPDDVFDPASLETLKRIVVTRGHPRKDDGAPIDVTHANVRQLQVGHGGDSIRRVTVDGEDHPEVDVTITDGSVIGSVTQTQGGRRRDQVSLGYFTEVVPDAGVYKGIPYTHRHKNIRYNHLAVDIEAGRCGPTVAMLLDEADALLVDENLPAPDRRQPLPGRSAVKLIVDGIEVELPDAGTASVVKTALDKRDAELATLRIEVKTKADALDATQAKLDQAEQSAVEAKRKTDEAPDIKAIAKNVFAVLDGASQLIELTAKRRDELLDLQGDGDLPSRIRRAVVLEALPGEATAIASKSDAYVEARFDALLADATRAGDSHVRVAATMATASHGESRTDRDPDLTPILQPYDPLEIMSRLDDSEKRFVVRR